VKEGKWLNGVIEAMFVDLSVTVRDIETKMVHTDIQRPQVNPVMAQGIDAYKKVSSTLMSPIPHPIGTNPDLIRNELMEEGKEWTVAYISQLSHISVNCRIYQSTVAYISQLSHIPVNCRIYQSIVAYISQLSALLHALSSPQTFFICLISHFGALAFDFLGNNDA